MDGAHLRIARATNDLERTAALYRDGLGFEEVGRFEDHDGFDGVMLGHPGGGYHLEFTRQRGEEVPRAPTEENLLVFYLPDREDWERACARAEAAGFVRVASNNPFWDRDGRTFEDPEGYRVVLENSAWER